MESYVIRIYRRESQERVVGLLIDSRSGQQVAFHDLVQLTQCLTQTACAAGEGNGLAGGCKQERVE